MEHIYVRNFVHAKKREAKGNYGRRKLKTEKDILKSPEKACKINGFMVEKGAYYTTTTPFLKEPWMTKNICWSDSALQNKEVA